MTVTPEKAAGHFAYKGQTYYFCGLGCLKKFSANPESYLQPKPAVLQIQRRDAPTRLAPAAPTSATTSIEYTCPMHPEVVRNGPGSCPICGMALEPRTVTVE